jgi:hypothetical protein
MGLLRVGERMKRARRRMAARDREPRRERRRSVPNMVVVLAGWRCEWVGDELFDHGG